MDRVLIVVPTYNERDNLPQLVAALAAVRPAVDVLVVDDASPDGTAAVCRGLMRELPRLDLLVRVEGRGLGGAYLAGLARGLAAGYDVLGTMDADLSHDPARLPAMLDLLREADVVVGSRYVKDGGTVNWRLRRILLSWLANRFSALLLGVHAQDVTSGFRLYRAAALRRVDLATVRSTGYSFLVEMLFRLEAAGARIAECPIVFVDRRMGRSKLSPMEIPRGVLSLLRLKGRSLLGRGLGRFRGGARGGAAPARPQGEGDEEEGGGRDGEA